MGRGPARELSTTNRQIAIPRGEIRPQHDGSEALFCYFRPEDQVPEHHLLRLIDKHIGFEFVRQQLNESYSETGRPYLPHQQPPREVCNFEQSLSGRIVDHVGVETASYVWSLNLQNDPLYRR
jgi:hypothetical protein